MSTYPEMTGVSEEAGHGHAPYSDELILRAIAAGLDSDGEPLNGLMPRWQMAMADQQDLIAFLRSL